MLHVLNVLIFNPCVVILFQNKLFLLGCVSVVVLILIIVIAVVIYNALAPVRAVT